MAACVPYFLGKILAKISFDNWHYTRASKSGHPHLRTVVISHIHYDFLSLVDFGQSGSFSTPHGEPGHEVPSSRQDGWPRFRCQTLGFYLVILYNLTSIFPQIPSISPHIPFSLLPKSNFSNINRANFEKALSNSNNPQWPTQNQTTINPSPTLSPTSNPFPGTRNSSLTNPSSPSKN